MTVDIDSILNAPRSVERCHDCGKRRQVHGLWLDGDDDSPSSINPERFMPTCKSCTRAREAAKTAIRRRPFWWER